MSIDIRNGNCLELMKTLPDKSIDLLICDLPYGETNCKWDSCIDLDIFWKEFKRIRKSKKTACIHFCSTKFGYNLISSNPKMFKMDLVWKKRNKTGGLQSKYRPMRNHEMVYFFYEQAPKYNRDKYHKRIKAVKPMDIKGDYTHGSSSTVNTQGTNNFEPPNPPSIIEDDQVYSKKGWETGAEFGSKEYREKLKQEGKSMSFEPVQPGSVIDQVYGDANGGDGFGGKEFRKKMEEQGEKVVGFTPVQPASVLEGEEAPCEVWGWEDNKKRIEWMKEKGGFTPVQPGSVVEEETDIYGETKSKMKARGKEICNNAFEPPNPSSVVEEEEKKVYKGMKNEKYNSSGYNKQMGSAGANFEPVQPGSVVEGEMKNEKYNSLGYNVNMVQPEFGVKNFDPPNPGSVLEDHTLGTTKLGECLGGKKYYATIDKEEAGRQRYEPCLPISVIEDDNELDLYDFIENPDEAPFTVYESKKCFVGKRNHQTEKPLDILEFFLKYWSDEEDTILDPTMGSGSTGVACAKMNRNFIGFELNEKIFKKAEKRIKEKK